MTCLNVPKSLTFTLTLVLVLISSNTYAQSRTCIIDDQTGRHHCGWLADEQGYRISGSPQVVVTPVMPPIYIDRSDNRSRREIEMERERDQRYAQEQQRMHVQEQVNRLYLDVLGRDADHGSLRNFTVQVMDGRSLSDVRIELATSSEARNAINRIYREILRREADTAGLNAQISGLRSGMSLAQIRQAIQDSPEARSKR
ncbi:MAG TPA: hypothetical protein PKC80_05715 [Burkholderiaceae bacterium]|nr:hypothetical protein [Burkholderiaceae bacterium]